MRMKGNVEHVKGNAEQCNEVWWKSQFFKDYQSQLSMVDQALREEKKVKGALPEKKSRIEEVEQRYTEARRSIPVKLKSLKLVGSLFFSR